MPDPNHALMSGPGEDDGDGDHSRVIVHVPLENLQEDGTPPSEGDDVEFDVKGTVKYVEDGIVCVSVTEINGEPVNEPTESAQPGAPDEEEQLKNAVNSLGQGQGPAGGAY